MGHATAMSCSGCHRHPSFADLGFVWAGIVAVCLASTAFGPRLFAGDVNGEKSNPKEVAQGRALFEREWQPGDSRAHGGDGLGPVYNDSSCVACHNQGGTGGAGSSGKNVDIITARFSPLELLLARHARPEVDTLSANERRQLEAFLKSLTAPSPEDFVASKNE